MADVESAPEQDRSRLLLEINNAVTSTLDLRKLFQVISRSLRPVIQHDGAAMSIYSEETNELRAFALDPPKDVKVDPEGTVWPLEGTPVGAAILTRQVVIVTETDGSMYSNVAGRKINRGRFMSNSPTSLLWMTWRRSC